MNRIRGEVEVVFAAVFKFIDAAHSAYNGVGTLVFQTIRTVVSQVRSIVFQVLDIVDGLVAGSFRVVIPKSDEDEIVPPPPGA